MQDPPEEEEPFPPWLRQQLLEAMLAADVVQFHHPRFRQRFLNRVERYLPPARYRVDHRAGTVEVLAPGGVKRLVRVEANHINIDVRRMRSLARKAKVDIVHTLREELERRDVSEVMLNIGRTDPSKNHVRLYKASKTLYLEHPEYGFIPYGTLLAAYPELPGLSGDLEQLRGLSLRQVRELRPDLPEVSYKDLQRVDTRLLMHIPLMSFIQRSRLDIPAYRRYLAEMDAVRAEVNELFELPGQPVGLSPIMEDQAQDELKMAGWMQIAVVMAAVSSEDGYALLWREAMEVNDDSLVPVVSENIGSFDDDVKDFVVRVNPHNPNSIVRGLLKALQLPQGDRQRGLHEIKKYNKRHDISHWVTARVASVQAALPAGVTWELSHGSTTPDRLWRAARSLLTHRRRPPGSGTMSAVEAVAQSSDDLDVGR